MAICDQGSPKKGSGFKNSPFGGRAGLAALRTWPCHATRRGFPTGPLPPYREERQREVVLSGRPALLLEAVMNSISNGLGMRNTGTSRKPNRPWNPHFYAIFTQVHNTL